MSKFGERLRQLRENKDLMSKEFAKIMNVEPATVTNWEKGNRFPKDDVLIKIADYFDVSIDYLLGRCDTENQIQLNNDRLQKATTLKDELIQLMIKRKIIKNKEDINEDHLKLIEMSIKTYADSTNNRKRDAD